jgi:hypothetical protein
MTSKTGKHHIGDCQGYSIEYSRCCVQWSCTRSEEEGVQEDAVAALLVLAVDADSRRAIGTEGCALVLKAMRHHGEETDLQRQCRGAVWNLANHEANKRALVEGGAEELIQAAAATHIMASRLLRLRVGRSNSFARVLTHSPAISDSKHG